jgi:hypothetical protein
MKDILIRITAFILLIYIVTYEIQTLGSIPVEINYNGTIIKQDYDIGTFYFEI